MYFVFIFFLSLSLTCLLVTNFYMKECIQKLLNENKNFDILLFIFSIISSLFISSFASFCECLIKTHLFGILFLILLSLVNNYCIIYLITKLNYFEQLYCALIVLTIGNFGLLINSLLVKDESPSLFILFIFNALFSLVSGCIMCSIYNKLWNLFFTFLAFFISEFNVYSSQYKFCNKKKKKEPLIYCQPFELNISIFKLFYFIIYLLIKLIKICCKVCNMKNDKVKKSKEDINHQSQENIHAGEEEKGVDREDSVGQEQSGGVVEIHDQSQV